MRYRMEMVDDLPVIRNVETDLKLAAVLRTFVLTRPIQSLEVCGVQGREQPRRRDSRTPERELQKE